MRMDNRLKNNLGFSLVELVVSLAVAGILITGIGAAMVIAMRHYSHANTEASLQESAQVVMNILNNLVLETDKAPELEYEEGDPAKVKMVSIYDAGEKTICQLRFEEGCLYYKTTDTKTDPRVSTEEVLTDRVKAFTCSFSPEPDIPAGATPDVINIAMEEARENATAMTIDLLMQEGEGMYARTYHTSKTIAMRNYKAEGFTARLDTWGSDEDGTGGGESGSETLASDTTGLKLTIATREFRTTPGSILAITGVSVDKGSTNLSTEVEYYLDPATADAGTRWSGGGSAGTWGSDNKLAVALGETSERIQVNVRAKADQSLTGHIYVYVDKISLVAESSMITAEPNMMIRISGVKARALVADASTELQYQLPSSQGTHKDTTLMVKNGSKWEGVSTGTWTDSNVLKIAEDEITPRVEIRVKPKEAGENTTQVHSIYVYVRRVNSLMIASSEIIKAEGNEEGVKPGNTIKLTASMTTNPGATDTAQNTNQLKALKWTCTIGGKDQLSKCKTTETGISLEIPTGYRMGTEIKFEVSALHPAANGGLAARTEAYNYTHPDTDCKKSFYIESYNYDSSVESLGVLMAYRGQSTLSLPADVMSKIKGEKTFLFRKISQRDIFKSDKVSLYPVTDTNSGFTPVSRFTTNIDYEIKHDFSWDKLNEINKNDTNKVDRTWMECLKHMNEYGWRELNGSENSVTIDKDKLFKYCGEKGDQEGDFDAYHELYAYSELIDGTKKTQKYSGGAHLLKDTKFELAVIEKTSGDSGTEQYKLAARGEILVPGMRLYLNGASLKNNAYNLFLLHDESDSRVPFQDGEYLKITQDPDGPAFDELSFTNSNDYSKYPVSAGKAYMLFMYRAGFATKIRENFTYINDKAEKAASSSGHGALVFFSNLDLPHNITMQNNRTKIIDEYVSGNLYCTLYYPYGDPKRFYSGTKNYTITGEASDKILTGQHVDHTYVDVHLYIGNIKLKNRVNNMDVYDTAYLPPPGSAEDVLNSFSLKELTNVYRPDNTTQAIWLKTKRYSDQTTGYDPYLIRLKVVDGVRWARLWRPTNIRYYGDPAKQCGFTAVPGTDLGQYYYDKDQELWIAY